MAAIVTFDGLSSLFDISCQGIMDESGESSHEEHIRMVEKL